MLDVGEVLEKMTKLHQYNLPFKGEYTLFILPNGKMVGENKNAEHQEIIENVLNRKMKSNQELADIYVELRIVKIRINKFNTLHVAINVPCTSEQKQTLKKLGSCEYKIAIDELRKYVPDAPDRDYYRSLLHPSI